MSDPGRLIWHLRSLGISVTQGRIRLYQDFGRLGPCTLEEVIGGVSRATVYRNIRMFASKGVLDEVRPGVYELTDRFIQHRHYKVCRKCGAAKVFYDEGLEKAIHRLESDGFAIEDHRFELEGLCWKCSGERRQMPIGTRIRRSPGVG